MSIKKEFYKKHVDRRSRFKILIYFLIFLTMFGIVLYDSFNGNLPFHYILFFLIGRFMSVLLKKTQKAKWNTDDQKIVVERNITGWLIIFIFIFLRIFLLPKILTKFHVELISDAVFLIIMGWFLGRIRQFTGYIDEKVFSSFMGEDHQFEMQKSQTTE